MISDKMCAALNDQIARELYSEYLYLSMAACLEAANLRGFAHWMKVQAGEERGHAMKLWDYVYDQGGRVTLQALPQPPSDWAGPLAAFEATLEHEKSITASINNLVALAQQENDYATAIMLQWFVTEQVEEEASAQQVIDLLKLVGESGVALVMADRQMAQRE